MAVKLAAVFFISIFFASLLTFLLKRVSLRKNILISQGTPLVGGISIGMAFFIASFFTSFFWLKLPYEINGVILGSGIILISGIIDDRRELSIIGKFLIQIIATTVLILFGVRTRIVYIGEALNIIITYVWIIGITNAMNHLDVMDGLAGGVAVIASFFFFSLAYLNNNALVIFFSLSLIGALLGFLIYNLPPAKVYMGNSGSHFLGFVLGSIALIAKYATMERKAALLAPLLILGFPIFDTAFLIWIRISKGKSAFNKSNDHLALRFLKLGFTKRRALLCMGLVALTFSACGFLVSRVPNPVSIVVVILVVLLSLFLAAKMSRVSVDG